MALYALVLQWDYDSGLSGLPLVATASQEAKLRKITTFDPAGERHMVLRAAFNIDVVDQKVKLINVHSNNPNEACICHLVAK
jgi:hypothetical protein